MIKHKYSPNQDMLGKFMAGMPTKLEELPPPPPRRNRFGVIIAKKEEEHEERKERRADDDKYADGRYSYQDMTRQAVWVLEKMGVGTKVLVCPSCKSDVEPVVEHCSLAEENADKWFAAKMLVNTCSTARCGKCNRLYFLPELVVMKSFRLCMPDEDTSEYHCFLRETFIRVNPDDLFGNWVWVHDFLVQPCPLAEITGKTFEDLHGRIITMDDVRDAERH